jgi:Methyltransferase TYW3
MYGEIGEIPYGEIDCEIRYLVKLINDFPGIRTISTCAGHTPVEAETSITFIANDQSAVSKLFAAMPFWGLRAGFVGSRPRQQIIWASVDILEERLVYNLQLGGSPLYVQRQLVGEVEKSLANVLAHPQEKPATYPTYATSHMQGKGQKCSV